jgi:hypothetical protein
VKIVGVSDQVKRVMDATAISMDDLQHMVDRAAIVTHESGCNRRYHSWIMHWHGTKVLLLRKLDMTVYRHGLNRSPEEECEDCFGDGCAHCGWVGRVKWE